MRQAQLLCVLAVFTGAWCFSVPEAVGQNWKRHSPSDARNTRVQNAVSTLANDFGVSFPPGTDIGAAQGPTSSSFGKTSKPDENGPHKVDVDTDNIDHEASKELASDGNDDPDGDPDDALLLTLYHEWLHIQFWGSSDPQDENAVLCEEVSVRRMALTWLCQMACGAGSAKAFLCAAYDASMKELNEEINKDPDMYDNADCPQDVVPSCECCQ